MAKKPLGKDKFGAQKSMRFPDYFCDSLGQFGLNTISGLSGQLMYFYTEKIGLAATTVATLFFITKIIDAFTDLAMAKVIDMTPKGKERYRPWLLKAGIPGAVLIALMFMVPDTVPAVQLAYMFITNILLTAVFYTAICIPFNALLVVSTESQEERGNMGTWRAAAGYVSGMVIVMTIIPVTNMLGGTQSAWIKYGVVFAAILILCFLICYLRSRESTERNVVKTPEQIEAEAENVPFGEALKMLFKNKYWVMVLIAALASQVTYGLANNSGTYYAKYIYGNDNLVGLLGAVGMIPTLLGFLLVTPMIKKLGVTNTLRVAFTMGAVATALRLINPYHFWYNTILGCFSSFANIPMMCLMGVLTAMSIDYNEYKYGKRLIAYSQSASGFGGKVGNGIGSSIVGWLLGVAGYDTMVTLTEPVKQAIFGFNIYLPLALWIIMMVISFMFDLEPRLPAMRKEIAERKANAK